MRQYHHQPNAFSGQRTYTLYDDHIEISSSNVSTQSIAYNDIHSIQIQYDPTRVQLNQYITVIHYKGGKLKLTNSSYLSFGSFEEHNEAYHSFITKLHQEVSKNNPNINYFKGTSKYNYLFSIFSFFFIIVVILFAILFSWQHQFLGLVAVKVIVLLFSVPYLIAYMKRNKPQKYDPQTIPTDGLPLKERQS